MSGLDLLTFGTEQYRVGSWRGDPSTAYLAPLTPPERTSLAGIDRARERLARQGFRAVLTAALAAHEQPVFQSAGFTVHERLHLLRHDLAGIPPDTGRWKLRRGQRWHRRAVLAVDRAAFDDFWRLDPPSLVEALQATPSVRFRIAVDRQVVGYAVTGLAGEAGYLQRLAVHPSRHGAGLGTVLVFDALRWLRSRHATFASVNTQQSNDRALALYEHLGFVRVEPGLAVLRCDLGPST